MASDDESRRLVQTDTREGVGDEPDDECPCGGPHVWKFVGYGREDEPWKTCRMCGIGMEA